MFNLHNEIYYNVCIPVHHTYPHQYFVLLYAAQPIHRLSNQLIFVVISLLQDHLLNEDQLQCVVHDHLFK